ncbi:MAG TPA: hypothetical protein VKS25_03475 [Solirubrobacteraceae bacterium]|nr:hypothetical protein [Solirubrobacteraceae bacterium]
MEHHGTITELTLKPLAQTTFALGTLRPGLNRLGVIGEELDYAREATPPSVDSLLAASMALLVFVSG